MCGRYTLAADRTTLSETFPQLTLPEAIPPRYNIAPSQEVAVVANTGERVLASFRWGLIQSWAKDPGIGHKMINARAESLAEKPSFRIAYQRRRCLILADGFYEWAQQPGSKTKIPVYIRLRSGRPFAFAGLWEAWRPADGPPVFSCTIITTTPNELIERLHHRMPVIMKPDAYDQWLDPTEQPPERLDGLLVPYPAAEMIAYPVSSLVNNPKTDSPACIEPVKDTPKDPS